MNYKKAHLMLRLKHIFRLAAFASLGAFGLLAGCTDADTDTTAPKMVMQTRVEEDVERTQDRWGDPIEDPLLPDLRRQRDKCLERQARYMLNAQNRQEMAAWMEQLNGLNKLPLERQLEGVNWLVNKNVRYRDDIAQYNQMEYWASPVETIISGVGDCEDYAIAKYALLRWLGVDARRLSLGVVASDSAQARIDHGVLFADISPAVDGTNVIVMDNNSRWCRKLGETGYKPYFVVTDQDARPVTRVNLGMKPQ